MSAIDRELDTLERDVQRIASTLGRLVELVDDGGDEYPGELTPAQTSRLGAHLGAVGVIGARILERDLERTARREGAILR